MRVYQIVAEGARPKILPEIIAHRQALQPQSMRELRDWLKHRAGGARYRAQQLSRQARQYEVMLARLDEMNVVTAPALKLIK